MISPFIILLLPPLLLVPAMGILSAIDSHGPLETELRRKAFHVSVGLVALFFPLILTEPWMVFIALSLAVVWMIVVRQVPILRRRFGGVLHDATRVSYGELYFAASVAALLIASSGEPVLYVIPILILTISDAAAAIVGRAFPWGRLGGPADGKTLSGSAAFFVSALCATWALLGFLSDLPTLAAVVIAVAVAATTSFAEAISSRGFDNLAVPAVAFFVLKHLAVGV